MSLHVFTIYKTDFFNHRIPTRVCKDHRVSLVFLVAMDITGYQAATVEMEQKVTKARLVPLVHVVRKETRGKMVQTLTTETGNSVRGGVKTTKYICTSSNKDRHSRKNRAFEPLKS